MVLLHDTARLSSGGRIYTFATPTPGQTPRPSLPSAPILSARADAAAPPANDCDDCDVALPSAWPADCAAVSSAPSPAPIAPCSFTRPASMRDRQEPHLPTALEHGVFGLGLGLAVSIGRSLHAQAPKAPCTADLVVIAASLTAMRVLGEHAGYQIRFGTLSPQGTLQVTTGDLVTGLVAEGWRHL